MDNTTILSLIKARLGISTTARDTYLSSIIESVITELEEEKGIELVTENANHQMFVVDYAAWRYLNRDTTGSMPRHLQFRLRNLYTKNGLSTDV